MSINRMSSLFAGSSQPQAASTNVFSSTSQSAVVEGATTKRVEPTHMPSILNDFREQIKKGVPISLSTSTMASILDMLRHGKEDIDDRKLLLEHALTFLSHLPPGRVAEKLQNAAVTLFYNDLPHPATAIGTQYAWRSADGSGNNVHIPDMGKAGTPYARSVQQTHPIPANRLPDPGLVFDTLLKRDKFEKHPAGLSSMMFSFAALVIHSVFRTSHVDVNINETSSYVDLSPLYGHNQEAQDRVRVRDGRGYLHPDVFAEDRLLLLPPAVCVILVLFSRNHNYIARRLLEINERGTFVDPTTEDPAQKAQLVKQEEELFQTARLCNAAWFASVVFSDYFSCILGLIRKGSSWSLNPFGEIRRDDHSMFERGQGNVCSVEFNCLYRWHATTSVEDEKWVEDVFANIFEGKQPGSVGPTDFQFAARKIQAMQPDITHWSFGNLKRQENGYFSDADLANVLHNATEHPAGSFRARGTPAIMRLHEVMGIEQNRRWGVCSLNDFRKSLGLRRFTSFLEWNSNKEIADAAEKLYGDIEHLELYVGLQAEEAKPVVDGAGLCPGYTISRAILSDAIALTRGDRFFTYDYTPFNMTAWGFADCQRDPDGAGFGSTLGRLFLRTLPEHFTHDSTYTWFPLMTPESMKTHLKDMGVSDYDLSRPKPLVGPRTVSEYSEVLKILNDPTQFKLPYSARASRVIPGDGFFVAAWDATKGEKEQREVLGALLGSPANSEAIEKSFHVTTRALIIRNSFDMVGSNSHSVDLVRDVLKVVPIYWAATEVAGIDLGTKDTDDAYTLQELYVALTDIYSYIFLDVHSSKLIVLDKTVTEHVNKLLEHIKGNFSVTKRLSFSGVFHAISNIFSSPESAERRGLAKRLEAIGQSSDQLANSILAILVSSVELSISLTNMVNLYLDSELEALHALATSPKSASLEAYTYEALRLDPPFRGVYRRDQGGRVFADLASASTDSRVFSNADRVQTDLKSRPKDRYLDTTVASKCFGEVLHHKILGSVASAVFGLGNIRRGPGQSGKLTRFEDDSQPILRHAYLDDKHMSVPWPTSMVIQYDSV